MRFLRKIAIARARVLSRGPGEVVFAASFRRSARQTFCREFAPQRLSGARRALVLFPFLGADAHAFARGARQHGRRRRRIDRRQRRQWGARIGWRRRRRLLHDALGRRGRRRFRCSRFRRRRLLYGSRRRLGLRRLTLRLTGRSRLRGLRLLRKCRRGCKEAGTENGATKNGGGTGGERWPEAFHGDHCMFQCAQGSRAISVYSGVEWRRPA